MKEKKRIHCVNCQHYFVTWDKVRPKGCHFFNFKSEYYPSLMVHRNSGSDCQGFKEKKQKKEKDREV